MLSTKLKFVGNCCRQITIFVGNIYKVFRRILALLFFYFLLLISFPSPFFLTLLAPSLLTLLILNFSPLSKFSSQNPLPKFPPFSHTSPCPLSFPYFPHSFLPLLSFHSWMAGDSDKESWTRWLPWGRDLLNVNQVISLSLSQKLT